MRFDACAARAIWRDILRLPEMRETMHEKQRHRTDAVHVSDLLSLFDGTWRVRDGDFDDWESLDGGIPDEKIIRLEAVADEFRTLRDLL